MAAANQQSAGRAAFPRVGPRSELLARLCSAQRSLLIFGLLLLGASPLLAESVRERIRSGNEHFAAGRFDEALRAYQQAAGAARPEYEAELLHNQAAAHFKLGGLDEARELWVRAAALRDPAFEASIRYNLGNVHYAEALSAFDQQQVQPALSSLQQAGDYYRDALKLDPRLANARANLELADQLRRKLQESATSQPQSQPQSQPTDQQDNQNPASQPTSQPNPQSQSQPSNKQEGQDGNPQGDPEGDSQDSQDGADDVQPQEQAQQPDTQPSEDQPQTQPAAQTQPAQTQPAQTQPADEQQPQQGEPRGQPIQLTPEDAERLLQKVRDAEKARRQVLLLREMQKHRPVERDW